MRRFLLLLFPSVFLGACASGVYTYKVTVPAGSHPSRMTEFEKTGANDSPAEATVRCTVIDLETNEPMRSTVLIFNKSEERTALAGITGENGTFNKNLPPGAYDLEIRYTGKNTFRAQQYVLEAGNVYKMTIALGDSGIPDTRIVRSHRPLSQEEAERKAMEQEQ